MSYYLDTPWIIIAHYESFLQLIFEVCNIGHNMLIAPSVELYFITTVKVCKTVELKTNYKLHLQWLCIRKHDVCFWVQLQNNMNIL